MKEIHVAVAVIIDAGRVLIAQRKAADSFGGYWEFPGGKREADESLEQCVIREAREELGLVIQPLRRLGSIAHRYDQVHLQLHPFLCRSVSGEARPIESDQVRWVLPRELPAFVFPPANGPLIEEVLQLLRLAAEDPPQTGAEIIGGIQSREILD